MPHASRLIADLLERFLAEPDAQLQWTKATAWKHSFLPLYVGWIRTIGLRTDGQFVIWNHEDDPEDVQLCTNGRTQRLALVQGAKKYPELAAMIPARPPEAVTCASCKGAGVFAQMPHLICECGGIGWTLPDEDPGPETG